MKGGMTMFKRIRVFTMAVILLIFSGVMVLDQAVAAELVLAPTGQATALTVSGKDVYIQHDFAANETPWCELVDKDGYPLPDGSYKYELRTIPITDPAIVKKAYEAGDEVALAAIRQVEKEQVEVQFRKFKIVGGNIVWPE